MLASRRNAQSARANEDPDFVVDDGDEDAWVHDGVDDIHIDPETKRAASEHSYDERSIDSEYEPREEQQDRIKNRTRITTIAEVIPMSVDGNSESGGGGDGESSSKLVERFLPAAHLSMAEIERLMALNSPSIKLNRRHLSSASGGGELTAEGAEARTDGANSSNDNDDHVDK